MIPAQIQIELGWYYPWNPGTNTSTGRGQLLELSGTYPLRQYLAVVSARLSTVERTERNSRGPCWSEYKRVYVRFGTCRSSTEAEGGRFNRETFRSVYGLREELHAGPRPTRITCKPKPHGPTDSHIYTDTHIYILYMQLLVPNPHVNRWRRHVKVDGETGGAVHSEPDIRRSTRDPYESRKNIHKRLELGQELNTDYCGAITGPHSRSWSHSYMHVISRTCPPQHRIPEPANVWSVS